MSLTHDDNSLGQCYLLLQVFRKSSVMYNVSVTVTFISFLYQWLFNSLFIYDHTLYFLTTSCPDSYVCGYSLLHSCLLTLLYREMSCVKCPWSLIMQLTLFTYLGVVIFLNGTRSQFCARWHSDNTCVHDITARHQPS